MGKMIKHSLCKCASVYVCLCHIFTFSKFLEKYLILFILIWYKGLLKPQCDIHFIVILMYQNQLNYYDFKVTASVTNIQK